MLGLPNTGLVLPFIIVAVLGVAVGIAELISRYPDDPLRAIASSPGVLYVVAIGLICGLALFVGAIYQSDGRDFSKMPFSDWELVLLVMLSGLGGMAFFRTKIFTLRVGETDVGVGPIFVLETILKAIDRAVARIRAVPRSNEVRSIMEGVSFENARTTLPSYSFRT